MSSQANCARLKHSDMPRDYYDILGLQKGASPDDIKKAYRKKAHELHPDKGGSETAFKEVNEAYQVLGDEKKRRTYDQFGHSAFQGGGPGSGGFDFGGFNREFEGVNINFDDLGDLGDVIGSMFGFGGGTRNTRKNRGRDVEAVLDVDFLHAVHGTTTSFTSRLQATCDACTGSGASQGSKTITCEACGGKGQIRRNQRTPFGVVQTAAACETCHGRGSKPEKICGSCGGSGVTLKNRTMNIQIPAGINDGETMKIAGQGEAAPFAGTPGDLYVRIRVKKHPVFERDRHDISSTVSAPVSIFFLGGTVDVETVDGTERIGVPAHTHPGTIFKIGGKGVPFLHSKSRGDHLVTLVPDAPRKLTREQKKLIEELRNEGL